MPLEFVCCFCRSLNVPKVENERGTYLVFEYLDLHSVIQANILEEVHKKYIVCHLFKTAT